MKLKILNDQQIETQDTKKIIAFLAADNIEAGNFFLNEYAKELQKKDSLNEEERKNIINSYQDISKRFSYRDGYRADVVCFYPEFEHMDFILEKFGSIHYHYENEFWYFFDGQAKFGFLRKDGVKYELIMETGDYLQVPEGRWQWFTVPEPRRMKAIRMFYTTHAIPEPEPIEF